MVESEMRVRTGAVVVAGAEAGVGAGASSTILPHRSTGYYLILVLNEVGTSGQQFSWLAGTSIERREGDCLSSK